MKKLFAFVCALLFPVSAFAATYDLLAPIGAMTTGLTLSGYLQGMFQFLIGMAGVLAVVMIVWCGIKLMGAPSAAVKSEAKQCITNAVLGIVLAASAWIILNTINAQLISSDLNLGNAPTLPITSPPGTPAGTYSWTAVPGPCPAVPGKLMTVVAPALCTPPPIPFVGALCCSYVDSPLAPPVAGLPPIPVPLPVAPPPPPLTTVIFNPNTYTVSETVPFVTITVVRSAGIGAGTVKYTTSPNSATPGADYTHVTGVLNFPIGVTIQTFNIPILNDALTESPEKLTVTLSDPTGDVGLKPAKTAEVTITSEDSWASPPVLPPLPPGWTAGPACPAGALAPLTPVELYNQFFPNGALENLAYIKVVVVWKPSGLGKVSGTVDYKTVGGTAIDGVDYTGVTGTMTINDCSSTQEIVIPFINDALVEGQETFSVVLSNPTGNLKLGVPSTIIVAIEDDESLPPSPPPDLTPPTIIILDPLDNSATNTTPIKVKYTFFDNLKVDSVIFTYAPPAPGVAYTKSICEPGGVPMVCPQTVTTLLESVPLDLSVPGVHQISVTVCDGTFCPTKFINITVQAPCVNTAVLTCKALPVALDPVFPICAPGNGLSGSFVGLNTDAYKFNIKANTGGGNVYVAGGFNNEYPPQHPLEARSCVPSLCDTVPLDGSCTCVYGTATYDWEGTYLGCTNDVPENLVISISDFPGDLSSTPASVSDGFKTVTGNCGSAGTGAKMTWGTKISTTAFGPGICTVQANREYYVNISTLPFSAASKGANEYSLFWDYSPI